jgi:hypothetical protein
MAGPKHGYSEWGKLAVRRVSSHEGRLTLAGLDPQAKVLAVAGLVVLTLASAFVLALGFGWSIPGGTDQVPNGESAPLQVPRVATTLAYLGLGIGAAIGTAAAQGLSGRWEWAVRAGIGFVGAALAGTLLQAARFLEANPLGFGTITEAAQICGWIGLACAVAVACTPPKYARKAPSVFVCAAAAPALLACALYLPTRNVSGPPGIVAYSTHGVLAFGVLSIFGVLAIVVSVFVLWQAIAGIRASRAGATRFSSRLNGRPLIWLGAFLAVKLAWLGFGYAGLLPTVLGGGSDSWADSRHDGLLSWVIAICFASAALLALARLPLHRIDERGLRPVAIGLVAAFTGFFFLAGVALLAYAALGSFSDQGALRSGVVDAINWLGENLRWSTVIAVYAAALLALILLLTRRRWVGLPFLVVFAVWAMPRALSATPGLGDAEPFRSLGINVVTFDAVLTLALAGLLLAWWLNWQRLLPPAELALILGVSTLVAHASTVFGSWDSELYFYVALVLPAAFLFLFDARALNREDPTRRRRVLAAVASASVLLTLVAIQIVFDQAGPGHVSQGALVQVVMAVPIAGVLVAAAIAGLRSADLPAP